MENGKGNVTICENNTLRGLKSNITHELVHAYDYCRVRLSIYCRLICIFPYFLIG